MRTSARWRSNKRAHAPRARLRARHRARGVISKSVSYQSLAAAIIAAKIIEKITLA